MECDKEKQDDSGDALNQVEPVSRIRIVEVVRSRFRRNDKAINRVIDQRDEDTANLDKENIRNRLKVFDRVIEIRRARECLGISIKVLKQEKPERHDARQLMELA